MTPIYCHLAPASCSLCAENLVKHCPTEPNAGFMSKMLKCFAQTSSVSVYVGIPKLFHLKRL